MKSRFASPWTLVLLSCVLTWPLARAQAQLMGDAAAKFTVENFVTGVSVPTDIAFLPGGRAVVTLKGGEAVVVLPDGTLRRNTAAMLAWPAPIDAGSEKGLLGVVADPSFAANKTLYFFASTGNDNLNKHKIYKATIDDTNTIKLGAAIVDMGLEGPANHDGGGLIVHNNQLYISVGDTGLNNTPPLNKYGTCLNNPNGKILRVNLDGSIPDDNPLTALAEVTACDTQPRDKGTLAGTNFNRAAPDKRVYAWGMRNPFRFWVDPMTGLLWIGDVGEEAREEISVGGKGTHFGWPFVEGTVAYTATWNTKTCKEVVPSTDCTPPVFEYPRQNGDTCVIGGLIPDGCGWPEEYKGKYIFGDHTSGRIFTLDVTPDRRGVVPNSRAVFAQWERRQIGRDTKSPGMSSFRMGPDGALYVTMDELNAVVRFVPKDRPPTCNLAPASDGGAPPAGGASGPDAGSNQAGGMGGARSGGSTGGSAGSGSGAGGAAGTGMQTADGDGDGGCGCSINGRPGVGSLLVLATLALLARRRRR